MSGYIVTWVMAFDASDHEDAARQALEIQRDPASVATVFSVRHETESKRVTVDVTLRDFGDEGVRFPGVGAAHDCCLEHGHDIELPGEEDRGNNPTDPTAT